MKTMRRQKGEKEGSVGKKRGRCSKRKEKEQSIEGQKRKNIGGEKEKDKRL